MANFVKEKQNEYGLKNRKTQLNLRCSVTELENLDLAVEIANKRRNLGGSRMDLIAYLVDQYINKEDKIRVISKAG